MSWNRCSWIEEGAYSSDDDDAATDRDYETVYHVLEGGGGGGTSVLEISDSKRLSLLDILRYDELSCFKKTFVPRAA